MNGRVSVILFQCGALSDHEWKTRVDMTMNWGGVIVIEGLALFLTVFLGFPATVCTLALVVNHCFGDRI